MDFEHKCYVFSLPGLKGMALSEMVCIFSKSFQVISFDGEDLGSSLANNETK